MVLTSPSIWTAETGSSGSNTAAILSYQYQEKAFGECKGNV